MLSWFKNRRLLKAQASELYGRVVAQSRSPEIYADFRVPDTPEGRLEAIIAHLVLIVRRLRREGEAGDLLARAVAETFVTDMDDCMREMGIGDLTVPRKVKKAAGALYDRSLAYEPALASGDTGQLAALLAEHATAGDLAGAEAFARYMSAIVKALDGQPGSDLLGGRAVFPPPSQASEVRA